MNFYGQGNTKKMQYAIHMRCNIYHTVSCKAQK